MRKQGGASLLFLMLIVALAVLVAVWMALPWFTAMRQEQIEKDINRGVTPTARMDPSQAAARERALMAEFVEAHGGFGALAGTEHYRALSARCRELVDAYVGLLDKPADAAADNAALRANVARIERSFETECAERAAAHRDRARRVSQADLAGGLEYRRVSRAVAGVPRPHRHLRRTVRQAGPHAGRSGTHRRRRPALHRAVRRTTVGRRPTPTRPRARARVRRVAQRRQADGRQRGAARRSARTRTSCARWWT